MTTLDGADAGEAVVDAEHLREEGSGCGIEVTLKADAAKRIGRDLADLAGAAGAPVRLLGLANDLVTADVTAFFWAHAEERRLRPVLEALCSRHGTGRQRSAVIGFRIVPAASVRDYWVDGIAESRTEGGFEADYDGLARGRVPVTPFERDEDGFPRGPGVHLVLQVKPSSVVRLSNAFDALCDTRGMTMEYLGSDEWAKPWAWGFWTNANLADVDRLLADFQEVHGGKGGLVAHHAWRKDRFPGRHKVWPDGVRPKS